MTVGRTASISNHVKCHSEAQAKRQTTTNDRLVTYRAYCLNLGNAFTLHLSWIITSDLMCFSNRTLARNTHTHFPSDLSIAYPAAAADGASSSSQAAIHAQLVSVSVHSARTMYMHHDMLACPRLDGRSLRVQNSACACSAFVNLDFAQSYGPLPTH